MSYERRPSVKFSVDYPDCELNRLTSALRIFTVIPIALDRGATNGHTARHGGKGTAGAFILVTDVYPPVRMGP